jgi:hypothetical protein
VLAALLVGDDGSVREAKVFENVSNIQPAYTKSEG